jgi:site-specific recombinase XerD
MSAEDTSGRLFRSASWVAKAVQRAAKTWRAAELDPITLHDARHTCATFLIHAGVNAKAVSAFMGHANISVTFDLYGHLIPGSEEEAAGLVDAFLQRARAAGTTDELASLEASGEHGSDRAAGVRARGANLGRT